MRRAVRRFRAFSVRFERRVEPVSTCDRESVLDRLLDKLEAHSNRSSKKAIISFARCRRAL